LLLISDRIDHSRDLERALALWGPCTLLDVATAAESGLRSRRFVVSDVDLSRRESVEALREALAACRGLGTPYLCLLRERSPRSEIQANALGATMILPADTAPAILLRKVDEMLATEADDNDTAQRAQQRFVAASAALTDLLASAARGGPLPVAAINEGVDSINDAADDLDIGGWLDIVWNHDDLTYQHCLLVAGLAAAFARRLRFPPEARRLITSAAVLHDIGKARIPLDILHKPGKLTPAEIAVVQTHPQIGYEMLSKQGSFAREVVETAHRHHEYLDGSGYPQGLRAGEISDVVRMITICDIYAALIERRSYKAPMPAEAAYATLVGMGGKLDADLLRAFRPVVLTEPAGEIAALGA
jgi:putative nucleotidyltransferase with HDIG domain